MKDTTKMKNKDAHHPSAGQMACAILAAGPMLFSAAAVAQDEVEITGTVRDFQPSHPDFQVIPSAGLGHYAANIDYTLGSDHRPVFAGGGFKVSQQWSQVDNHPIPPHLYAAGGGPPVALAQAPDIQDSSYMDTWDSTAGPYGGDNVGPAPSVNVGAPMPDVTVPGGLPWRGNLNLEDHESATISSSGRYGVLKLQEFATITIENQVTIVCEGEFQLEDHCEIQLADGAQLDLYLLEGGNVENHSLINSTTYQPGQVRIFNVGDDTLKLENNVQVFAHMVSPEAKLQLENNGEFFGIFTGEQLHMENNGAYHHDAPGTPSFCGVEADDTEGTAGIASSGGISSSATFAEWYQDVMGSNLSAPHTITLVQNSSGVFEYLDDSFYPIDSRLFGNEGGSHNPNFTFAFTVNFTFEACNGLFFEFEGNDDAWMFIDDQLAMDLGGIVPGTEQYVEMDRLELEDGETYTLRFFYAHRSSSTPMFRLRTNLPLEVVTSTHTISAGYD